MIRKIFFLVLISTFILQAQDVDISDQLKQIKAGEIEKATTSLKKLRTQFPNDPAVIFLDALLTKDGDLALNRYESIIREYPNSQYVDASLYCVFSYHYALGNYTKAEKYLDELKLNYPNSPYLKNADRNLELPPDDKVSTDTKKIRTIEIPKPLEEKKPVVTDKTGLFYSIQVGAFVNIEKANELMEKITKQNYKTVVKAKDVGGTPFHLVLVGEYRTRDEAREVIDEINAKFGVSGRIVTIEK